LEYWSNGKKSMKFPPQPAGSSTILHCEQNADSYKFGIKPNSLSSGILTSASVPSSNYPSLHYTLAYVFVFRPFLDFAGPGKLKEEKKKRGSKRVRAD